VTAGSAPDLAVQPALLAAWQAQAPGVDVRGIAGAVASGRGAVVAVLADPHRQPTQAELDAACGALAAALGVPAVELVTVAGADLAAVIRQWVHQAAQGSGRGVGVSVRDDGGAVRVRVTAVDSSARELSMRLASPHEPALPALAGLVGRAVEVADGEAG
jgi:hypothetical protein